MKEPGQLAYEATPTAMTWEQQPESAKALWAITESTIRADEAAKVIEECAKVARDQLWLSPQERTEYGDGSHEAALKIEAAIHSLGSKKDG
jgi:hypothetical protein